MFRIVLILVALTGFSCKNINSTPDANIHRDSLSILSSRSFKYSSARQYAEAKLQTQRFNNERLNRWEVLSDSLKFQTQSIYDLLKQGFHTSKNPNLKIDRKLYLDSLKEYLNNVLNLDPEIRITFQSEFEGLNIAVIRTSKHEPYTYFLDRLENAVSYVEYQVSSYITVKMTPMCDLGYEGTSILVGQNSQIIRRGGKLVITAGVGSFSRAAKPQIEVNGEIVGINDNNVAEYTLEVSSSPGKYRMPVVVKYTDMNGEKMSDTIDVDYEVE